MTAAPQPKDRYAVFGNPIAHSKSPVIHTLFAEQTKQNIEYTKQLVAEGDFANAASKFFAEGGKGLNITVPFKLDAYAFAEQHGSVSDRAKLAGAVNTLKKMPDGKIFGDNTDGVGLVRDITQNLGWPIEGKRILILGAGGAVRGAMYPILEQQPASILINNRTAEKTSDLINKFKPDLPKSTTLKEADGSPVDLIINGTSASLSGDLPSLGALDIVESTCCYDMMYGKDDTVFMQWAKKHGCKHVFDGLGMLVEQAAESFYIWRGVRPETAGVIRKVRELINSGQ